MSVNKKVFVGGTILTMDGRGTVAEAISWARGRVVAVGGASEVVEEAGPDAEVLELPRGRVVVPGFLDAHHHLGLSALFAGAVDCSVSAAPGRGELRGVIAGAARELDGEGWLVGAGFDEGRVAERRLPTLKELDAACSNRPLALMHYSFHGCLVNSRGLEALGITEESRDPPAGRIGRGPRGRLTGWLAEAAMTPAWIAAESTLFARDPDGFDDRLAAHARRLLAAGVTRVADPTVAPWLEDHYRRLHDRGALPLPVVMMPVGARGYLTPPVDRLSGFPTGVGPEALRVGGLKLFADGGDELALKLEARELPSAALALLKVAARRDLEALGQLRRLRLRPGADLALRAGTRFLEGEAIFALAREAVELGFSLAIHAMGNQAVEDALDLIASVRAQHRDSPPPRVEHAFLISDEQLRRAADLGVHLVCQPSFLELARGLSSPIPRAKILPLRSALDLGVSLALSSDHPVVDFAPLAGVLAAVTREGGGCSPVHLEEAITAEEALTGYTRGAAKACGCLDVCGELEPGKRADLVVLSADPRRLTGARLGSLEVEQTLLGGELVFDRRRGRTEPAR